MTKRPLILVALLAASPLLAGCFTAQGMDSYQLASVVAPLRKETTWWPVEAYDGNGSALSVPMGLTGDALPVAYQLEAPSGSGEPVAALTVDGALYVTVSDGVYRSLDQGRTWNLSYALRAPEEIQDRFYSFDRDLWLDPDTGRLFMALVHPHGTCIHLAWTDDGEEWVERPFDCLTTSYVHPKLVTAPPSPEGLPLLQPREYPNLLYLCADRYGSSLYNGAIVCSVSYDGGMTWLYEIRAYNRDNSCGVTPDLEHSAGNVVGPMAAYPDGTVLFTLGTFHEDCTRSLTVLVTEDNGLNWEARQCAPEYAQVEIDADITITPDGTAYLLFRDVDQITYLARSRDKFLTCDVFRVSPQDHVLNRYTAITSGDDGRIAMAYFGTRDTRNMNLTPGTAKLDTHWHLFVTVSLDADGENPTFTTLQTTPNEDPVQVACVGHLYHSYLRNCGWHMWDSMDMARDAEGRWFVAFTDGCTRKNGCAGRPEAEGDFFSADSKVSLMVQDRGASLFAEKGVLPSLGLEPLKPFEW